MLDTIIDEVRTVQHFTKMSQLFIFYELQKSLNKEVTRFSDKIIKMLTLENYENTDLKIFLAYFRIEKI